MAAYFIEKSYENHGALPELESGNMCAKISSISFKRGLSQNEGRRRYSSSINFHAQVIEPDTHAGRLLEVSLVRFEDPSIIRLKSEEKFGIGLLFDNQQFLEIDTVFDPLEYERVFKMLFSVYLKLDISVFLSVSVLGLGKGCEWNLGAGPLLVEGIDFLVGAHET